MKVNDVIENDKTYVADVTGILRYGMIGDEMTPARENLIKVIHRETNVPDYGNAMSFEERIEDELEFGLQELMGIEELYTHPAFHSFVILTDVTIFDDEKIIDLEYRITTIVRIKKVLSRAIKWSERAMKKPDTIERVFMMGIRHIAEIKQDLRL